MQIFHGHKVYQFIAIKSIIQIKVKLLIKYQLKK
jgi:hypothetical protein